MCTKGINMPGTFMVMAIHTFLHSKQTCGWCTNSEPDLMSDECICVCVYMCVLYGMIRLAAVAT